MKIFVTFAFGNRKKEKSMNRIRQAMDWVVQKAKSVWQALFGIQKPVAGMKYDDWRRGKSNFYDVMQMRRPYSDLDFNVATLRANERALTTMFREHLHSLAQDDPRRNDDEMILVKIQEAFKTLERTDERILYNLSLDYRRPGINWGQYIITLVLGHFGLTLLLSKIGVLSKGVFITLLRKYRGPQGIRGSGIFVGTIPTNPPIINPETPLPA